MDPALSRLPDSMSLTSFGRRAVRAIRRGNKGVIELIMRAADRGRYRQAAGLVAQERLVIQFPSHKKDA